MGRRARASDPHTEGLLPCFKQNLAAAVVGMRKVIVRREGSRTMTSRRIRRRRRLRGHGGGLVFYSSGAAVLEFFRADYRRVSPPARATSAAAIMASATHAS